MIEATRFAHWMTAIADRTRAPLAPSTNALYYGILSAELTTEEFEAAALHVLNEYDEFGFPPPAVFMRYAKPAPVFDGSALLRQIEKLATYNPNSGMIPAPVGVVRERFGDVVADAYATASAARLFSDDETTRNIAQREFQHALERYAAMPFDERRPLIASPAEARTLGDRRKPLESIGSIVNRALPTPVPEP
jgi:hypothetical protein